MGDWVDWWRGESMVSKHPGREWNRACWLDSRASLIASLDHRTLLFRFRVRQIEVV